MDKRLKEIFKKHFSEWKLKEIKNGQYAVINELGNLDFTFSVSNNDNVFSVKTIEGVTFANYYIVKAWCEFLKEFERNDYYV